MVSLDEIGWDAHWQRCWEALDAASAVPARVASMHREGYAVWTSVSLGGILVPSLAAAVTYRRRRRKPQDAASTIDGN